MRKLNYIFILLFVVSFFMVLPHKAQAGWFDEWLEERKQKKEATEESEPVSLENPSKKSKEKSRQEKAQEPVRPRRAGAKDTAPEIVNSDDYVESNYAHIDPAAENYEHVDPSIDPIEYYEEYGEMPSHLLEGESKLD